MIVDLGVLYGLAVLAFWIWAVFDSITASAAGIRNLPKGAWVLIVLLSIVLGPLMWLGPLAWILLGRPAAAPVRTRPGSGDGAGPAAPWRRTTRGGRAPESGAPGSGPRGGQPPIGPDDDPDFLRRI